MQKTAARVIGQLEQRFNNIMNSRLELSLSHVGKVIRAKVSGNPQYGWYDPSLDAFKDLYSFNVSKATVIDSPWFTETHAKAIALEAAGNADAAGELFNSLLNKSQLSYGVINSGGMKQQFGSGQIVDLFIATVKTEDKVEGVGQGTFHTSLVVDSISAAGVTTIGKTRRFGEPVVEEEIPAPEAALAAVAAPVAP
jgi:hypothetical protein